jgi:flavin reductase (DIM6/NTAB) family NADH-FMN oxidoreductase RutF
MLKCMNVRGDTVDYKEMPLDEAYRLINVGPVVMVSTVSRDGEYDVAPIAWACPAGKAPTRVMVGVGKRHKTFSNIEETKVFVVGIPNISQVEMIKATGSVSGNDVDKFTECNVKAIAAGEIDCKIPEGMIGYIECNVTSIYDTGKLALIVGNAIYAAVDTEAYDGERILSDKPAGKTVHHMGNKRFITLGDHVIE